MYCKLDVNDKCIPERYGETWRDVMSPPRERRNAGSANQSASVAFHAERQSSESSKSRQDSTFSNKWLHVKGLDEDKLVNELHIYTEGQEL